MWDDHRSRVAGRGPDGRLRPPRGRHRGPVLTGAYRLSKRLVVQAMGDLFNVEMSLGAVTRCERIVSAALAAPVEEAREFVKDQLIKQADETSWYEGAQRKTVWLWVAHTAPVSVFADSRLARREGGSRGAWAEVFGYLLQRALEGV